MRLLLGRETIGKEREAATLDLPVSGVKKIIERGTSDFLGYYYRKQREGSRVKSVYVGRGEVAHLISNFESHSTDKGAKTMSSKKLHSRMAVNLTNLFYFVLMPISDPEGYEKGHFRRVYRFSFLSTPVTLLNSSRFDYSSLLERIVPDERFPVCRKVAQSRTH